MIVFDGHVVQAFFFKQMHKGVDVHGTIHIFMLGKQCAKA